MSNYHPEPPIRFCANCGRHCGKNWRERILCRTCTKEAMERVKKEPFRPDSVNKRMDDIRKNRNEFRRKNDIPY